MKLSTKHLIPLLMLLVLLLLPACGVLQPSEGSDAPTVDPQAIIDAVLSEVQNRADEATETAPTPEPVAPTPDPDAIAEAVLAEVESRLAEAAANAPTPEPAADQVADLEAALVAVYQRANPSVVYIITGAGSGSGFVYDDQGHIVTNNHVVEGYRSFEIVFADGERRTARLVGTDPDSDLAVIQVEEMPDGVQPLPLAQPGILQVGQFVVAIGNPFGEQGSMSWGIVSGLGRSLPSQRAAFGVSSYSLPQVIQTDAPINPGNSGGPLLNLAGEVVGVNAAIASTSGASSGVGFSIPVAAVHLVAPSLIADGEYVYPYMGISFASEISLERQEAFDLPQTQGAYVIGVADGSPAVQAGLVAANANSGRGGDLVIAIDGQTVIDFSDLNSYLVFQTAPGQTIDLTVLRDGQTIEVPLTLGARP
jgi:2-alkenal reductase